MRAQFLHYRNITRGIRLAAMLSIGLLGAIPMFTHAVYVEPQGAPPGGAIATPLDSSNHPQRKLGSLSVGLMGSPYVLCLNANGSNDPGNCINAWTDVATHVGGQALTYVNLQKGDVPDVGGLPAPADNYLRQLGTVRIKGGDIPAGGSPTAPVATVFNDVSYSPNPYSGVYADDSNDANNYAAHFSGKLIITKDASGTPGKLCLNDTDLLTNNLNLPQPKSYGCISQWTDIVSNATVPYVKRQTGVGPIAPQSGTAALMKTGIFGSVVLGTPLSYLPVAQTCGDGYCSANEDATSCPLDCASISAPVLTAASDVGQIQLTLKPGAQSPAGNVYLVVVRSDDPLFPWQPMDGIVYSEGGTSPLAIVYSRTTAQNVGTIFIADHGYGMAAGKTYYYRAYQGNLFPRYSVPPVTASATSQIVAGGPGGGPSGPPDIVKKPH